MQILVIFNAEISKFSMFIDLLFFGVLFTVMHYVLLKLGESDIRILKIVWLSIMWVLILVLKKYCKIFYLPVAKYLKVIASRKPAGIAFRKDVFCFSIMGRTF